jgi:hypothetical protein
MTPKKTSKNAEVRPTLKVAPNTASPNGELEEAKRLVKELEAKQKQEKVQAQAPLREEYNQAVDMAKKNFADQMSRLREQFKARGLTFGAGAGSRVMSDSGKAAIGEGTRLFILAGKPTKEQLVLVYGEMGPRMTWTQRAKAGVPAEGFQAALKAKL